MSAQPGTKRLLSRQIGMNLSLPLTRRDALRIGLFGTAGMLFVNSRVWGANEVPPEPLVAAADDSNSRIRPKTKSIIQIFLWGGMSHIDTWDPKPDAGRDYMGEFPRTLPTNVDGIQIGELFPNLAKQADKYSLIRSMTHRNNGHETAAYMMQTAHAPGEGLAYPSVGAVFSLFKSGDYKGLIPPYVVLTQPQGRFCEEGFLGAIRKPFATGGDPNQQRFEVEGVISRGISDERQVSRRQLLANLDTLGQAMAASPQITVSEEAKKEAYELILGPGRDVFDLSKEKSDLRDRYGRHTFGQECLAARRMVEAGVPYITISFPGGWDTHSNHFATMRAQCPMLDEGLAMLLVDLSEKGLLDSTLVWCTGEFGRTPKISWEPPWNGGRHHHGAVFTVLVAGGGFKGGRVVGSSDEKGEKVKERPVYPADLLGSMYLLAGIDATAKLPHPWGLDVHVLDTENEGMKSAGLLEEIL